MNCLGASAASPDPSGRLAKREGPAIRVSPGAGSRIGGHNAQFWTLQEAGVAEAQAEVLGGTREADLHGTILEMSYSDEARDRRQDSFRLCRWKVKRRMEFSDKE